MAEIGALPSKSPKVITRFFLERIIARYGCCAEVLTDNRGEFMADFDATLSGLFIDHRTTSANHPQGNGLAERAVQTIKRAVRKQTEERGMDCEWDEALPYIQLGYNCSAQASTRISPYQLIYGVAPTVPPAIKERMEGLVELDDPKTAADLLIKRAQALKENCVTAADNLLIAQHRDTLRYAHVRSGSYAPRLFNLRPGSFVYLRREPANTAQMKARPEIYRIVAVRRNGVLLCIGRYRIYRPSD